MQSSSGDNNNNNGLFPFAAQMLDCTQKICELTMNTEALKDRSPKPAQFVKASRVLSTYCVKF